MSDTDILARLERVIATRVRERPAGSYVTRLVEGGEPAMTAKIREEAHELCTAATHDESVHEAADLWFHTLVLLAARGVELAAVCRELERRFGTGGLTEKAARAPR